MTENKWLINETESTYCIEFIFVLEELFVFLVDVWLKPKFIIMVLIMSYKWQKKPQLQSAQ